MRTVCLTLVVLFAGAGLADTACALFDTGGHISRQLAVGTFVDAAGKAQETTYLTWQGNLSAPDELTLWAFCSSGNCPPADDDASCHAPNPSPPSCADVVTTKCQNPQGCDYRWKAQFIGSLGSESYAPPVTASAPERVYVATKQADHTGRIYSFDACGNCQWGYDPLEAFDIPITQRKATVKNGFYARPTVYEFDDGGGKKRVIFAASWGKNGASYLHSVKAEGFTGEEGTSYTSGAIKTANQVYMAPVVDQTCGCVGASGPCATSAYPRVYIGVLTGDKKKGLWAVETASETAYQLTLKYQGAVIYPAFRFGGTILPLDGKRFMLATLEQSGGAIALELPQAGACGDPGNAAEIDDVQFAPGVAYVHRSRPVVVYEGSTPVVYLSQKEGGPGALIHRFEPYVDPNDGHITVYNPASPNWPWPAACGGPQLASTSWSTPAVHSYNGSLMFGTVKLTGDGVLRLPVDDPCSSTPADPFFFYRPEDGWRSEGVFTDNGRRFHVGSSHDHVYTLEAEARNCAVVDWCYDMDADEGGRCFVAGDPSPPACCTAAAAVGAPCLDMRVLIPAEQTGTWIDANADRVIDASEIDSTFFNSASKELAILDFDADYSRNNAAIGGLADGGAWARCHAGCTGGTNTGLSIACPTGTQFCDGGALLSTVYGWIQWDPIGMAVPPIPLDDGDNYLLGELTNSASQTSSTASLMIRVP